MKNSSTSLSSISQWAFTLATTHNTLIEAAKPFQLAYAKATPEQAHELRVEWRVGFIMGRLNISGVKAMHIVEQKRAERTAAHEAAVNLAAKQFATYVSCTSARATKGTKDQAAPVAIPRALKAELRDLLATYSYEVLLAAVKAAKPVKAAA